MSILRRQKFRQLCIAALALALSAISSAAPDPTGGVYVRDSDVAVEKFALADRMERSGEWGKASTVYQELLQGQADRVVASSADPTRFTSVVETVQERLSRWTPNALNIYRDQFGPEAQSLLESAEAEHREDGSDDSAALHRVLSRYFVTDAAKTAGLRLMETAIEDAEFAVAATIGNRLLDHHPLLLDDRPRILYRTALAEHLMGQADAARAKLSELKQKFPGALGTVRGVDVVLADSLAIELSHVPTPPIASRGESWPMPFGSPDHARVQAVSGLAGAHIVQVPLDNGLSHPLPGIPLLQLKQNIKHDQALGVTLGVVPVVDRGELFFQDNAHIYAVSLESGRPLPGWQESYPGDAESAGRYSTQAWPMPRFHQSPLCVTDDSVLAVMGFMDSTPVLLPGRISRQVKLICLDRETGRERWTFDAARLPADQPKLRQLAVTGVPLVIGDNVYLTATSGVEFQDCYVLCLDKTNGAYKWSSYVASANNPSAMFDPDGSITPTGGVAQLAYSAGRLFVSTNVGAVAALDASDGSIDWLDLYPRDDASARPANVQLWINRRANNGDADARKPWTINPVIVRDGKMFACPSDATGLLVYDAATGTPLQKVGLTYKASLENTGQSETASTLVGITGDAGDEAAVLASDRSVFCVALRNYDPAKGMDNLRWCNTYARDHWSEDSIRGRPFLTKDSVVIPLAWSLVSVSLRNGAAQATFPATGVWDVNKDGPGNVLLTPDHLIIAGAQNVNVYTDLAIATGRLDLAIETDPKNAQLWLRYGEILFAARRFDGPAGALAKLDQAARLMGVTTMPSDGSAASDLRKRLFNDALDFALNADASPDQLADRGVIDALFDRSGLAASTPAEQVTYRLRRAEHLKRANNPAAELALYQQILLDPAWRNVTVSESEKGAGPASGYTYQTIVGLLQRAGRGMYSPYEAVAAKLLADASGTTDATARRDQLTGIVDAYPNSDAAHGAMLSAAAADESLGDVRGAASLLRKFMLRYAADTDRATVLESLARLYLAMPSRSDRLSVAIGRLEQGAKLPDSPRLQQPLRMPDGSVLTKVTFTEAAASLRKFQASVETRQLPDPRLQKYARATTLPTLLPEDPAALITDATDLVDALDDPTDAWDRNDRIVAFSASHGLSVYAVGKREPLFTIAAVTEPPLHVAWIGQDLLVCCPTRLMLIKTDSGTVTWETSLQSLPPAEVAAITTQVDAAVVAETDPQPADNGIDQRMPRNGIAFFGNRRFQGNRRFAPPTRPVSEQIDHVIPSDDRIVFTTAGPSQIAADAGDDPASVAGGRIVSINFSDGRVVWQTRLPGRVIDDLNADDDFVAVRATGDADVRLIAFDAQGGQPVWRPAAFSRANNDAACPVNLALAQDGSLVYTMPDRLCCKDLFDPDPKLRFEKPTQNGGTAARFAGFGGPDQLLVRDGKIFALSDAGAFVRIYQLADGKPFLRSDDSEPWLNTTITANASAARLRLVGNRLYIFGPERVVQYGLSDVDDSWNATANNSDSPVATSVMIRDMVITRTHALLLLVPQEINMDAQMRALIAQGIVPPAIPGVVPGVAPGAAPGVAAGAAPGARSAPTTVSIRPFSRTMLPNGRESGIMTHRDRVISDPAGITDVQVVDGGVYYRTGDQKIHFLHGLVPEASSH